MNLTLSRLRFTPDGIFGELYDSARNCIAKTLEHSYNCAPKLPEGVYTCVRGVHQLHSHPEPFETFEVTGVAGHQGILFHVGNYNDDSEGCVLLGEAFGPAMIVGSRDAFQKFMTLQVGVDSFQLTVKNTLPPPPASV